MTNKLAITVSIAAFSLVIVRYLIAMSSSTSGISRYQILETNPLEWLNRPVEAKETIPGAAATDASTSNSSDFRSSSPEVFQWLDTWNQMKQLSSITNGLPHASEAINDGRTAWGNLTASAHNASYQHREKERLCPYSIRRMDASKSETDSSTIGVPCGLIVGSSITLIGTPGVLSGNFWIDLVGAALPGEPEKPTVLQYNVRLYGDKITKDPVILQNTFTANNGWGVEDRCPSTNSNNATEVDDLERCNAMVGREGRDIMNSKHHTAAKKNMENQAHIFHLNRDILLLQRSV